MAFTRNTIITSFFWKLFENIGTQLVQFVVTIVLARLLLPSEYGIIALISVFIQLCGVIIDSGFNTALIQKKGADNIDFSTIFFFCLGSSIFMYFLMFFFAPAIAEFYEQDELISIIRVLSLSLLINSFYSIQYAYVSKNMLFKKLFYSNVGAIVLSGGLGIYSAYQGFGIWSLVIQNISGHFFATLIMWFTIKWRPILVFSIERFKVLFDYGWKIFGSSIIISLFVNIRKLIIGKFYTPLSLAYYEKGEQLPMLLMNNIFNSIQAVLFPTFSEEQHNRIKVKTMMRSCTKMCCFFLYPLMIGMIVTAKPIVVLLLTEKWLPIVPFMQILCIAIFFRPITFSNWEVIKALGYSNITLKLEILKKVIDVTILIVSVNIGVYAIAWGCVLYDFVCVFINLAPNKKLLDYGIAEQIKDVVPTLLIALAMGAAVYWIQLLDISNVGILTLQILSGTSLYILLSWMFKEESFVYILQLIKEKKHKFYQ